MRIKIMAVDDNPAALDVLTSILEPKGYQVIAVKDSRDAVKLLELEKVDGLFLDVEMPHFNGFELTKMVRTQRLNGRVPIVMLTGSDDSETMRKGFDVGINFFLGKPFTRERVHKLMEAVKGFMVREQLRYIRIPLKMTVGCSWASHTVGLLNSECQNISEGGMYLGRLSGVELGQGVTLAFTLPDILDKLTVNSQVVRKAVDGGLGMQFVALHPEDKSSIQRCIGLTLKN